MGLSVSEKVEAKAGILEMFRGEPRAPSQILAQCVEAGMYLNGDEHVGPLLLELFAEGKIRIVRIGLVFHTAFKPGPSGILEALFELTPRENGGI